jgi:threonine/homoserine/homoserine lactone efflux protein
MEPNAALLAGLAAGLAIAMQVGAVSLLLVDAAVAAGPRAGVAAGMGVAAADLGFAAIAAAAGGAAGAALASHETEIRLIAAVAVAAIAIHGLIALARERRRTAEGDPRPAARGERGEPASAGPAAALRGGAPRAHCGRFLAITAANPLTIASFAAVAAALSLDGPLAAAAFAGGVGIASAGWHLALSLAAGHAGRWMTPPLRLWFGVVGRVAVLGIAVHLALG